MSFPDSPPLFPEKTRIMYSVSEKSPDSPSSDDEEYSPPPLSRKPNLRQPTIFSSSRHHRIAPTPDGTDQIQRMLHELSGLYSIIGLIQHDLRETEAELTPDGKKDDQKARTIADLRTRLSQLQARHEVLQKKITDSASASRDQVDALQKEVESLSARTLRQQKDASTMQAQIANLEATLRVERQERQRLEQVLQDRTPQVISQQTPPLSWVHRYLLCCCPCKGK